jgi:hypothetical protein
VNKISWYASFIIKNQRSINLGNIQFFKYIFENVVVKVQVTENARAAYFSLGNFWREFSSAKWNAECSKIELHDIFKERK